jgi:hypothetical protein
MPYLTNRQFPTMVKSWVSWITLDLRTTGTPTICRRPRIGTHPLSGSAELPKSWCPRSPLDGAIDRPAYASDSNWEMNNWDTHNLRRRPDREIGYQKSVADNNRDTHNSSNVLPGQQSGHPLSGEMPRLRHRVSEIGRSWLIARPIGRNPGFKGHPIARF